MLLQATEAVRGPRWQLGAVLALSAVPFASFAVHARKQSGLDVRADLWPPPLAWLAGPAALLTAAAAAVVLAFAFAPRRARAIVLGLVMVLSPLTVVGWLNVLRHGLRSLTTEIRQAGPSPAARPEGLHDVYVFVFDELDYHFLYERRQIRPRYARLRQFGTRADHYHAAFAPGGETLSSMMGLLLGRSVGAVDESRGPELRDGSGAPIRLGAHNVFAQVRARGYRTALYGWLHPYCEMLAGSLDQCRSFGVSNYASTSDSFSLANPLFTNLIVQPPSRLFAPLLYPAATRHQRNMVDRTFEAAVASLDTPAPLFLLAHFSIPHRPFAFDARGYAPARDPFLQDSANYERQLDYVDRLFGRLLDEIARRGRLDAAQVAVLSDHGYRVMRPGRPRKIPLLVKWAEQGSRRDLTAPFESAGLLQKLLESGAVSVGEPAGRR